MDKDELVDGFFIAEARADLAHLFFPRHRAETRGRPSSEQAWLKQLTDDRRNEIIRELDLAIGRGNFLRHRFLPDEFAWAQKKSLEAARKVREVRRLLMTVSEHEEFGLPLLVEKFGVIAGGRPDLPLFYSKKSDASPLIILSLLAEALEAWEQQLRQCKTERAMPYVEHSGRRKELKRLCRLTDIIAVFCRCSIPISHKAFGLLDNCSEYILRSLGFNYPDTPAPRITLLKQGMELSERFGIFRFYADHSPLI